MNIRRKALLAFSMLLVFMFVQTGCQGSKSSAPHRGSTNIKIGFGSVSMNHAPGFGPKFSSVVVGSVGDVALVTVDINNGSAVLVQGTPLSLNGGIWSATINDLPVGEQLTITAHAYNSADQEIFTGETLQTLSGVDDIVEIAMTPASNGATLDFPTISQIGRPSEILISGTALVSISIQGSAGENLSYEITAAENGGAFSPSSGSITLTGTSATLVLNYTAPASAGNYTHSVKVTNSQGNYVATTFDTNVAAQLAQNAISVSFNPVVMNMTAVRSGSNVTVTATVSGTGPSNEFTYNWSFAGSDGYTFADNTTNPAVLNGSGSLFFGTLGLTVTNGSGRSTSVSYKIAFPKVSSVLILPQVRTTTGIDDCRFGAVSGNVIALSMDEWGGIDYNNDGDTNDDVLGYLDVTQGNVVNTGIAIDNNDGYGSVSIDGDIIAFQYPAIWNGSSWENGTIGYYSISAQTAFDTGIAADGFGRIDNAPTREVSYGKIAFTAAIRDLDEDGVPDSELHIYDTSTQINTPTGVRNIRAEGSRVIDLSFKGNIVAFIDSETSHLKYYDITTGITVDTQNAGKMPTVDDGIIAYNHSSGNVAYYVIASQENTITPMTVSGNGTSNSPSISDGIITATVREDEAWGDLNGSGILGDDDQGTLVLYDIATGIMVSTGLVVCCGADISGDLVSYEVVENEVNEDLNGDGDIRDCVQVYFRISDLAKQHFGRLAQ